MYVEIPYVFYFGVSLVKTEFQTMKSEVLASKKWNNSPPPPSPESYLT